MLRHGELQLISNGVPLPGLGGGGTIGTITGPCGSAGATGTAG